MSLLKIRDGTGASVSLYAMKDGSATPLYTSQHFEVTRISISVTPTITSGSAYAAGNVVGALLTFTPVVRGGDFLSGLIDGIILQDKNHNSVPYDLWLFDSSPAAGSTITDKTNLTISAAGLAAAIGFWNLNNWSAAGSGGAISYTSVKQYYKLASGTTLYGILIARGTPTYASTSDVTVKLVLGED